MPAPHLVIGLRWTKRRNRNTESVTTTATASRTIAESGARLPIVAGSTTASMVSPNAHMNEAVPLNNTMRRACSETMSVGSAAEPLLPGGRGVSLGTTTGCFKGGEYDPNSDVQWVLLQAAGRRGSVADPATRIPPRHSTSCRQD